MRYRRLSATLPCPKYQARSLSPTAFVFLSRHCPGARICRSNLLYTGQHHSTSSHPITSTSPFIPSHSYSYSSSHSHSLPFLSQFLFLFPFPFSFLFPFPFSFPFHPRLSSQDSNLSYISLVTQLTHYLPPFLPYEYLDERRLIFVPVFYSILFYLFPCPCHPILCRAHCLPYHLILSYPIPFHPVPIPSPCRSLPSHPIPSHPIPCPFHFVQSLSYPIPQQQKQISNSPPPQKTKNRDPKAVDPSPDRTTCPKTEKPIAIAVICLLGPFVDVLL